MASSYGHDPRLHHPCQQLVLGLLHRDQIIQLHYDGKNVCASKIEIFCIGAQTTKNLYK
jgi:hypothetical protein